MWGLLILWSQKDHILFSEEKNCEPCDNLMWSTDAFQKGGENPTFGSILVEFPMGTMCGGRVLICVIEPQRSLGWLTF